MEQLSQGYLVKRNELVERRQYRVLHDHEDGTYTVEQPTPEQAS
jgi:hypothetical protein